MDSFLPRLLSIILLLVSMAMLVPIGMVVVDIAGGAPVAALKWAVPLGILGTAAIMMWLLTRKAIPLQLYLTAFALWLLTAGYFFVVSR
jgi:hypothetical protein